MADFNVLRGPADPLPIKYKDMGDGTAAEVVSASVSVGGVTVDPFTPNGNVASLTTGAASANVALPAGTVVVVTNTGTVTSFLKLSVGAGTAAVTDFALVAGASVGLKVGSNTFINAITAGSAGALRIAGGAGLPVGFGGGSSGGGGGGDATAANQTLSITSTDGINTKLTAVTGTKAAGTAAASALLAGAVYNSTPPTLTNGQQASLQASAAGRLLVDAAITGGGDASAANQTAVQGVIGAATAPAKMEVCGGVYNSTPITLTNGQSSALQLDANGYLNVNIKTGASSGAVAQGSTTSGQTGLLMQGAVTTAAPSYTTAQTSPLSLTTAGLLRVSVENQVGVAQGSTTSGQTGSPILARTLNASPTDTTAQSNMPVLNTKGALITRPYAHEADSIYGSQASAMTNTTAADVIAAQAAGVRIYVTSISVSNAHASVGTEVEILDGSTVMDVIPAASGFGGGTKSYPNPLRGTAATALRARNRTTGASVTVSAQGYKGP